jgi:hypothetical protein
MSLICLLDGIQKQPLNLELRHDPAPWPHKRLDVPADPVAVISDYAAWSTRVVKLSRLLSLYNGLNC